MQRPEHRESIEPTCKKIQNYIFNFADLLGQGNFSKVYKAHHEITNEVVAIKIVELNSLKSKKLEELLFSEIEILKDLQHPNVLKCFQVFTSSRNCYIITEFCNDGDLDSKLRNYGPLSEEAAEPIIKDVFEGLLYLAEKNVVHRDIKTSNIFLHDKKAKIADFGFAKVTLESFQDINIGSPIYMSPEGLLKNVYGPKTDVWAFGILIYELLHNETPFANCQTQKQLKYAISQQVSRQSFKPGLSSDIKDVICCCLEIHPENRITFQELKRMPYFNKSKVCSNSLLDNYSLELKFGSMNFKNQGSTTQSSDVNQKSSVPGTLKLASKFNGVRQKGDQHDKFREHSPSSYKSFWNQPTQDFQDNRRGTSVSKNIVQEIQFKQLSPSARPRYSMNQRLPTGKIISAPLTFKSCVNMLHYCRLLFKHIKFLKGTVYEEANQINIFTRWLSYLLRTVNEKINQKEVVCDGDNGTIRYQKLREVAGEYTKKYNIELGVKIDRFKIEDSNFNFQNMKSYFQMLFKQFDEDLNKKSRSNSCWVIGQSLINICMNTQVILKCFQRRNYSFLECYKTTEQFLKIAKTEINEETYMAAKNKMIFQFGTI